jgi:hypothetical protein
MKVRFAVAVALVSASFVAVEVSAQTAQAPAMQPILAGKKLTPPIRGTADVDYVKPVTTRKGAEVITKIQVKNVSNAPIARLRVIETWFDKSGGTIPGGECVINGLLNPGEVGTIEIRTPYSDKLTSNSWNFLHANGSVKPHSVKSFDAAATSTTGGKEPATKTATAAKKK